MDICACTESFCAVDFVIDPDCGGYGNTVSIPVPVVSQLCISVQGSVAVSRVKLRDNAIVRFAHLVLSVGSYIKAKVRRVFTYLREGYCRPHFHGSRKRVCFFRL